MSVDIRIVAVAVLLIGLLASHGHSANNTHGHLCKWHGCGQECTLGNREVLVNRCGKNKTPCCNIGVKKLCCPNDLDVDPALAASVADAEHE